MLWLCYQHYVTVILEALASCGAAAFVVRGRETPFTRHVCVLPGYNVSEPQWGTPVTNWLSICRRFVRNVRVAGKILIIGMYRPTPSYTSSGASCHSSEVAACGYLSLLLRRSRYLNTSCDVCRMFHLRLSCLLVFAAMFGIARIHWTESWTANAS